MKRTIIAVALATFLLAVVIPLTVFHRSVKVPESVLKKFKTRFRGLAPLVCSPQGSIQNKYLVNVQNGVFLEENIHIHGWHHLLKPFKENWYKVLIFTEDGVEAIRADPSVRVVQCVVEYDYTGQPYISEESLAISGPVSEWGSTEEHVLEDENAKKGEGETIPAD